MRYARNKKHRFILYGSILLVLLAIIPVYFLVYEDNNEIVYAINTTQRVSDTIQEKTPLEQCFLLPENRDVCYFELCENQNSYLCTEDLLEQIVQVSGPEQAMDALNDIMASSLFAITTDGHLLAHKIGNAIAHHYGFSGESMLKCPPGFNWGCTHGFFEDALKKESDPIQAATEICESLPERPKHRKDFCYHGVGHIFTFNESYDVVSALALCDALPSFNAQNNCYQGALMENYLVIFIGLEDGSTRLSENKEKHGFMDSDPLAPCSRLANRYRSQCYANQGYYLLFINDLSVKDASRLCLDAGDHIPNCMTGIAIYASDPPWQQRLMEANPIEPHRETTFIENFAYLCSQFPSDYIEKCQTSGLSYLMGYDHIEDAANFCSLYGVHKNNCFLHMGVVFHSNSTSTAEAIQKCEIVPEEYKEDCREGAQTNYATL